MHEIDTTPASAEICEGEVYDFYGTDLSSTGTYHHTMTSVETGCDSVVALDLIVTPLPPTPVITENSGQLVSSAAAGNQWYMDGSIISGANDQSYQPSANGTYTVDVTIDGCTSLLSDPFVVDWVGIEADLISEISFYPNPARSALWIEGISKKTTISLYDITGKCMHKDVLYQDGSIDIDRFNPGIYIIEFQVDDKLARKKIEKLR